MADAEKELGNVQFKQGNYEQAIVHFSKAIALGATHVRFSNRSACYCGLKKYDDALDMLRKCLDSSRERSGEQAQRLAKRPAS